MGSGIFGSSGNKTGNAIPTPVTSLRIQSSIQGKALPIVHGQNRLAGNLIWYNGFNAIPVLTAQAGGGGKGGGKQAGSYQVSYVYQASFALALCEGPIADIVTVWRDKEFGPPSQFGFTNFLGSYAQAAWGFLTTNYPAAAVPFHGIAYLAAPNYDLGPNTSLPNHNVEVRATISNAVAGRPDADPKDVVIDWMTNANYGINFPTARLDTSMTQFSTYCKATGLLVSPVLAEQRQFSTVLADFLTSLNSSPRWSGGILTIVPWGDTAVTGNGSTYTPSITPLYDLTVDDFLPVQGGSGGNSGAIPAGSPVQHMRKRRSEMLNTIKGEYLSRASNYDPVALDFKDEASILVYGQRATASQALHWFCDGGTALLSLTLQGNRELIANTYTITLGPRFILPDVEDILTLTFAPMGLNRQGVRITDIQENSDGSLTFSLEEFLGTCSAPLYGKQASSGTIINTNADAGNINPPIVFEPTQGLIGSVALEVWAAVSGVNVDIWGGCNVFASYDDVTFGYIGQVSGGARMGVLTSILPTFTINPLGDTIDNTNTLAVDLTQSAGALASGTLLDAQAGNTACYVDGEIVGYVTATLTSTFKYNLTQLVRGMYGTAIAAHAINSKFARLDQGVLKIPYDQNRIGSTLHLKFQSFNVYGGGLQDISTLTSVPYVITGLALAGAVASPTKTRAVFEAGYTKVYWDEVTDSRAVLYEIRQGTSFDSGQFLASQAHAPFLAFGGGTFWIAAYVQPLSDIKVYSAPVSIFILGNQLVSNVIASTTEGSINWPGAKSAGVQTVSPADLILDPTVALSGTYTVAAGQIIDAGRVAACPVNMTWIASGFKTGQNILAEANVLTDPDILTITYAALTDSYPTIAISNDGVTYSTPTKFVPGVYNARYFKMGLVLTTTSNLATPIVSAWTYSVDVPDRIDHFQDLVVPADGLTITFIPDDQPDTPAAFHGGPDSVFPYVSIEWQNTAGDQLAITGLSLTQVTIQFTNNGVGVVRTGVNVAAEGY